MNKIKKLTRYTVFVDENEEAKFEFKSYHQEFDLNQNSIKEVEYTANGERQSASKFTYDGANRLIEEIHYYDGEGVGEMIRYKLNEEGKRVEIETTYADESRSVKKVSRFENMVSVKAYDEDGEFEAEDLVKFDENGNVLEETKFDEDRKIVHQVIYEYDKHNQPLYKTEYGEKNELLKKLVFEHDQYGNTIRETQLDRKDQPIGQIAFEYDADGNRTSWQNSIYIHLATYNKHNRIVKEETLNRRNNLVEGFTEYKYNEHGQLTEERRFSMGEQYELQPGIFARTKSDFIVTRYEYEYFED